MSSSHHRSTRSTTSETIRRRAAVGRRPVEDVQSNTDSTARLRDSIVEEEGDAGEDGLFLGFEHRMNTDERRRMRELERAEAEKERSRARSSSPSSPPQSRRSGTRPTGTSQSSKYSRSVSQDEPPSSRSSARRTAYARELERRDRQRDSRYLRASDDKSHASEDTRKHGETRASRRSDEKDDIPQKSIDIDSGRKADDLTHISPRNSRAEGDSSYRTRQPGERSSTHLDTANPSYRSKSRDSNEGGDERRRRREDRYRRERLDHEVDEGRRTREERKQHDGQNIAEQEDEERRRRREERKMREERRAVRRNVDSRVSVASIDPYRSGDDEPIVFDREDRERRREERRKQRELLPLETKTLRSDRRIRIEKDHAHRDQDRSHRSRSSDPGVRVEPVQGRLFSRDHGTNIDPNLPMPMTHRSRSDVIDRHLSPKGPISRNLDRPERITDYDANGAKKIAPQTSSPILLHHPSRHQEDNFAREEEGLIGASPGPSDSSSDSDSEDESQVHEPGGVDSCDEEEEKWTLRVCLISAVDLPFNVVPNVPLCPILKLGIVRNQNIDDSRPPEVDSKVGPKSAISEQIEKNGLLSIPKSRVRCTSSKILSKRDNGSMDFHEEMRWDDITRPNQISLALELCARAALPPTNSFESPLAKAETHLLQITGASFGVPSESLGSPLPPRSFRRTGVGLTSGNANDDYDDIFQRAIGKMSTEDASEKVKKATPNQVGLSHSGGALGFVNRIMQENEKPSEKDDVAEDENQLAAGIAGMRALWRKGRQQFESRQYAKRKASPDDLESGATASSVAKFLIGGKDDGPKSGGVPAEAAVADHVEKANMEEDVNSRKDAILKGPSFGTDNVGFGKRALPSERNMPSGDENVALQSHKKRRKIEMSQDLRLGSLVIPLSQLPLEKAFGRKEAARVEQWYQLDSTNNNLVPVQNPTRRGLSTASKLAARRNPSVLLEISFSAPEVLDESEDELNSDIEKDEDDTMRVQESLDASISFSRRTSVDIKKQLKSGKSTLATVKAGDEKKFDEDPVLASGVCDFIAVVGAVNIGDQSQDNGAKGWVNSNPECAILEQFPPNDEFHVKLNRMVTLQNKAEWFCFPEGCRLWRGAEPPSHMDLNLKRFSASSPGGAASSIAAFDACLNCTTSFSWFVIQSNEKENDFKNTKTYGAVIKFYAPAPAGIDSTQDDFAQGMRSGSELHQGKRKVSQSKRLWVPLGILLTSNLPIVGTMEAMLLRLCESLASKTGGSPQSTSYKRVQQIIHQDLANLIINFQKPIPGVLHCSIPFLIGERLHLTLPPPTGLPPLPHGAAVTSVCRLLGSEGINVLLAAALTECKILIHSDEIANLPMVAEVATALIYPFTWALPFLPVLPEAMLEFVEAPLSFFIGIPSCKMCEIDDDVLSDIVVIDLDNGFTSPDYYDGRRGGRTSKTPTPLPASVASNISKAVFRLLREEEEVEEEYGANNMHGTRSLPRLEAESLAEREFRIAVALQVCSLVRGYDECLFKVSANQPVFNRDKFLRTAPALFEDRRVNHPAGSGSAGAQSQKMLSPRSKRFLSILVNCQHFHQFLESLDQDECAFFNEVMYFFDTYEDKKDDEAANPLAGFGSARLEEAAAHLSKALQKVEDKIPTYRVERKGKKKRRGGGWDDDDDDDEGAIEDLIDAHDGDHDIGFSDDGNLTLSFTSDLLTQLTVEPPKIRRRSSSDDGDDSITLDTEISEGRNQGAMTAQFLAEFEKGNHWHYKKLFDIKIDADGEEKPIIEIREKVRLRDAIGERRYRAWKVAQEQKTVNKDNTGRLFTGDVSNTEGNTALDLTSLLSQVSDETSATDTVSTFSSFSTQSRKLSTSLTPEQQRVQDAKDRDVLRRCLERAYEGGYTAQRRQGRYSRGTGGSGDTFDNIPSRYGSRGSHSQSNVQSDPFFENGRDLIADAEAALRNPSAQKFLISVLSQRSRLENQRKRRSGADDKGRRGGNQATLSRLEPPAFDCLVRLGCAMLDACLENKNYEAGYNLLTQTQGFCTIQSSDGKPLSKKDSNLDNANVIYMTARISLHPIFAELDLWEGVLQMKLEERDRDRKDEEMDSKDDNKDTDQIDYDTTVSTLYEMLAFGVPSEELARFATCVSEKKGWFATERGHNLLLQARRLSAKRENGSEATGNAGDLDMMRGGKILGVDRQLGMGGALVDVEEGKLHWKVIGWCHPAAVGASRPSSQFSHEGESGVSASAKVGQNLLNMIGSDMKKEDADHDKYLKRSPVTCLAAFGPSIVASGGLDGSVFVAHTIVFPSDSKDHEPVVRGVRLDWGSSGSRSTVSATASSSMDGEYGVGAVSCLAAAKGAAYRNTALSGSDHSFNKDVGGKSQEDDLLHLMEGCRVIAGTTGGDLRVWSVKEVYAATALARKGETDDVSLSAMRISHGGDDGLTSTFASRNRPGSITEIAAGSAFSRLKVSLRGRALSGHRGGVACIDVPSQIYRPDTLVTGGADGFIKLWSLRSPTGRRASADILAGSSSNLFNASNLGGSSNDPLSQARTKGSRGGDALSILSGHNGRVLCVKTAWHGDRLLSGGADRTVRIWDLAGAGGTGKCLHELRGHLGWVTQSHFWGSNTVVSGSTDRSVALWDARVRRSPLFVLRYHKSPVSDLLVGSRTDPMMVTAAADGTVASWDFRTLSGSDSEASKSAPIASNSEGTAKKKNSVRTPSSMMSHPAHKGIRHSGAVLLSRGPGRQRRTVLSVGVDAFIREWDISSGQSIRDDYSYHVDVVSCFYSFSDNSQASGVDPGDGASTFAGTITSSWDGTVRMRKLVKTK